MLIGCLVDKRWTEFTLQAADLLEFDDQQMIYKRSQVIEFQNTKRQFSK